MLLLERVFPMNNFFPLYFYISYFTYSKEKVLPFLLFSSLFLDIIVYPYTLIHTLLTIVIYLLNFSWHIPHRLKLYVGRTILNTVMYIGALQVIYLHFSPSLLLSNIFWNILITFLYFKKRSFNFSKR